MTVIVTDKHVLEEIIRKELKSLLDEREATMNYAIGAGLAPTISSAQAATLLGCSRRTVNKWAKEGKIKSGRVGSKYIFDRDYIIKLRDYNDEVENGGK